MKKFHGFVLFSFLFCRACSPGAFISRSGRQLLADDVFDYAHVGISVTDGETNKQLYGYQSQKYFVPASNVKLFSLYTALKCLPDSIPGMHYFETADTLYVFPTGDPTFLHPLFQNHPVFGKLKSVDKQVVIVTDAWQDEPYGMGWSWDDFNDSYQAEKSPFPIYGNAIRWMQSAAPGAAAEPGRQNETFVFSEPEVNWKVRFIEDSSNKAFRVKRRREENYFEIMQGVEPWKEQEVPFITHGIQSALELLKDTLQKEVSAFTTHPGQRSGNLQTIYSHAKDSLLKSMMHRSDNFFAEQVLVMASNERLGKMSARLVIDSMMKSAVATLPQTPAWVDGSGLSRYNLFSPEDFIWLLRQMKDEFGLERMKTILPAGNEGTLTNYYKDQPDHIFAKTGTLTGVVALSGYLITSKNRLLIFSILVNNHHASTTEIRRSVEKFVTALQKKL